MPAAEKIIEATRKWIYEVVIGCYFCPFAGREMERGSIRYRILEEQEDLQSVFRTECVFLNDNPAIETTLIICAGILPDFEEYLDLLDILQDQLVADEYEGIYQLASFHPNYQFAGSPLQDPAHFTNRSPYPMFHILREESIEKALAFYDGDPDEIPERNIAFAREKGWLFMKSLRESCL